MVSFKVLSALALAGLATATLDPCTSNTKGKKPNVDLSSADKSSDDIQAAECSHNTRVSGDQTFAVFITDHSKDSNHGAPYGDPEDGTCGCEDSDGSWHKGSSSCS